MVEETRTCACCGKEKKMLVQLCEGYEECGFCFIHNWCTAQGPDSYDEEFVDDMRDGLEVFITDLERLRDERG